MEWLKQMSLKKSLFTIIAISIVVGLALYVLVLSFVYDISFPYPLNYLKPILQFIPPFAIAVSIPLGAVAFFYRVKLKTPISQLSIGAKRIMENDLDFSIDFSSNDELGELCQSFESMRVELLKSNRELWQQMEERKRLNAAFAHDLRNPVTVLKGSAAILQKGLERETLNTETTRESISLITQYSARIESYIQAMTSVQKLEELALAPKEIWWDELSKELQSSLCILSASAEKKMDFSSDGENKQISIDRYMVHNVAENLVNNAIRNSKKFIYVNMSCDDKKVSISVSDDGSGFSSAILKKGASPFLRDDNAEQGQNFGMGLYICQLLCEKHGGVLTLENHASGAKVTATFYF